MKFLDFISKIPPLAIDGTLYVSASLFAFLMTQFGTDEAAKFISPTVLFWLKIFVGSVGNAALNLKMFRSTSFADYQAKKNGNGHTIEPPIPSKT
jgi:hypothetical protein